MQPRRMRGLEERQLPAADSLNVEPHLDCQFLEANNHRIRALSQQLAKRYGGISATIGV